MDGERTQRWSSYRHFHGAAAEAMRRILMDQARRKGRRKNGVDRRRITIQVDEIPVTAGDNLLASLDEALQRFEQVAPTACELVKLRYFAGLSLRDAGRALELAPRTAVRLWAYAKAWLCREVHRGAHDSR